MSSKLDQKIAVQTGLGWLICDAMLVEAFNGSCTSFFLLLLMELSKSASQQQIKNWRSYLMWIHRPGFGTKLYHSTPYPSICGRGEGKGPLVACILPSWVGRPQVEVQDSNPPPHCHYSGGCAYPLSHLPGPALCIVP